MPEAGRKLKGVRAARAIRAFEKAGYYVHRVRGSHYVLKHPQRPRIVIARHGVVKEGLLLDKIKEAGFSVEGFQELLR